MRGRLRPRPALQPRHHARAARRPARRDRPRRARRRKLVFSSSVAVFGPDPSVPLPALRRRRHAAGAEDLVRHAQADLRAPDRRLLAQGLRRRPLGAPDDGHRAARPAERRRVVVLLGHRARAARRRRGDLPGLARRLAPAHLGGAHRRGPDRRLRGERRAARRPARAQPAGGQRDGRRDARRRSKTSPGRRCAQRVRFVRDETIAGIVANWPRGATAARAARLGLQRRPELRRHHSPVHRRLPRRRPTRRRRSRASPQGTPAMNQIDLKDRVAVVTGGAQGIGYAIAERMLASGAAVVALGRRRRASSPRPRPRSASAGQVARRAVELTERSARSPRRPQRAVGGAGQDRHPRQQRRHHRRQRARPGSSRPTSGAASSRSTWSRPISSAAPSCRT